MVSSTLPSSRAFAHGVVAVVGAIEIVVSVDVQPVRAGEQSFAPARHEIAVAVEHHHRMGAAVEEVDAVLAVDRDGGDVGELPAVRQLRPVLHHAVAMLARAENGWHVLFLPVSSLVIPGCATCETGIHKRRSRSSFRVRFASLAPRCENARGVAVLSKPPSSIALICSARYFELIRHCARLPAMNQRPACAVRAYMLRNSWPSPNPQIGPIRATTSSPNSLRTRSSCGL